MSARPLFAQRDVMLFFANLEQLSRETPNIFNMSLLYLIQKTLGIQWVTLSCYRNRQFYSMECVGSRESVSHEMKAKYLTHFREIDQFAAAIGNACTVSPAPGLVQSSEVFGKQYAETDYYQFISSHGISWALAMPIGNYRLTLYKENHENDFSPDEYEMVQLLFSVLKNKYNGLEEKDDQAFTRLAHDSLLNTAGIGSIIIDAHNRVMHINQAAEFFLMSLGHGDRDSTCACLVETLHRKGKRLPGVLPAMHIAIRNSIVSLARMDTPYLGKECRVITIQPAHTVLGAPDPASIRDEPFLEGSSNAITIHDMGNACFEVGVVVSNAAENLRKRGLSSRECDVALMISKGLSYEETAKALFLSVNTVRTHIRNIYRKLGIKNQRVLIKMIADMQTEQG